jgi:hypothetical protein
MVSQNGRNGQPKNGGAHAEGALPAYVQRVLDAFGAVPQGDGWVGHCIAAGHGSDGVDSTPSLRITLGKGGRILLDCRVGCGVHDVLEGAGLRMYDLYPHDGDEINESYVPAPATRLISQQEIDSWNQVYRYLLSLLPLDANHRADLRARGLSDETIDRNGYRTLRHNLPCISSTDLHDKFSTDLALVPGFKQGPDGKYRLLFEAGGILVPLRDTQGRVRALKVRRHNLTPKYVYLSSVKHGGPSPGNPCHVPAHDPVVQCEDFIRVTEGELKADAVFSMTGKLCLSCPGVTAWRSVLPVLEDWLPTVKRVLVAYDWRDVANRNKKPVRRQLRAFLDALRDRGYDVGVEEWDEQYKGLDDALVEEARGRKTSRRDHWGEQAFHTLEAIEQRTRAHAGVGEAEANHKTKPRAMKLESVDLTKMTPREVLWLWRGFIPRGGITQLDGAPGLGKTTLAVRVVAAVTRGLPVVDGDEPDLPGPADVIFLTTEDSWEYTLVPRLIAAGADLQRVHPLILKDDAGEEALLTVPRDVLLLEEKIKEHNAVLLVLDPGVGYLDDHVKAKENKDVRRALTPLASMLDRTRAAALSLGHLNKNNGASSINRSMDSIAFVAIARSHLVIGKHPDVEGDLGLAVSKGNLAPRQQSLIYRTVGVKVPVQSDAGEMVEVDHPVINWGGRTDLPADRLITDADLSKSAKRAPRKPKKEQLTEVVRSLLQDEPTQVVMLQRVAKAMGISVETLQQVSRDLNVKKKHKRTGPQPLRGSYWSLPEIKS